MVEKFSVEYSLKWGAYISRIIRTISLVVFIIWFSMVFNIGISRNVNAELIIASAIFLLMLFLVVYDLHRKERISLNKGILEIETFKLFKNENRAFKIENVYDVGIIPKEYMWNKIYGEENPSYVRYKMSFKYKQKKIWFADGLDHKVAFSLLSKMKENTILAEKLR